MYVKREHYVGLAIGGAFLSAVAFHFLSLSIVVNSARDLHGDECLYMSWGERMALFDDWLLRHPWACADKPPLQPISMGISMKVFGVDRWAAFLPNQVFGVIAALLVFMLARQMAGAFAGWFALLLALCSPYWIFYANSAFTDMGLLMMTAGAFWAGFSGRWLLMGVLAGGAVGFKQFGLLTVLACMPLLLMGEGGVGREFPARAKRFALGFVLAILPLVFWETGTRPRWFAFKSGAAGPALRGISLGNLPSNMLFWGRQVLGIPAFSWAWFFLAGLVPLGCRKVPKGTFALLCFAAAYWIGLSLFSLPRYPRYALFIAAAVVPVLGVGAARSAVAAADFFRCARPTIFSLLLAVGSFMVLLRWHGAPLWGPESFGGGRGEFLAGVCASTAPPVRLLYPGTLGWEFWNAALPFGMRSAGEYGRSMGELGDEDSRNPARPLGILVGGGNDQSLPDFRRWRSRTRREVRSVFRLSSGMRTQMEYFLARPLVLPPNPFAGVGGLRCKSVDFDNGARLLGARLERIDNGYVLVLGWECVRKMEKDWVVFVHCMNERNKAPFQLDHEPLAGTYPTTLWPLGRRIADRCEPVPAGRWDGIVAVKVGMYDFNSWHRAGVVGRRSDFAVFTMEELK